MDRTTTAIDATPATGGSVNWPRITLWLAVLLILGFAWRAAFIYRDPSWLSNYWLFEDFGYSLKIAKNIALGLGETFDGVVPTNGYQPLYVWLMVPVFWIFRHGLVGPMYAAVTLLAVCNVAAGYAVYAILLRLTGHARAALLGAAFWLFNFSIAKDGTNGLEAGLSTMLLAFTVAYYFGIDPRRQDRRQALTLGLMLGLSFLGRVDAVFLTAAVGAMLVFWPGAAFATRLRFSLLTLAGFLLLALPYALWNIKHFGSPLPTSGQVTSGKASLFDFSNMDLATIQEKVKYGLYIVSKIVSGEPSVNGWVAPAAAGSWGWAAVMLSIVACAAVVFMNRKSYSEATRKALVFLFLLGSLYMYGYTIHTFVAFQRYYLPVVFVLTILYVFCIHTLFWRSADRGNRLLGWAIALALVVSSTTASLATIRGEFPITFGWRDGTNELNRIAKPGDKVAALQSGNLGYFYTQGRAINLDGVVNLEAYRYRKAGELDKYLQEQKVKFLADEGGWVFKIADEIPDQERRARFLASLRQVHRIPGYQFNIYEIGTEQYSALRKLDPAGAWSSRPHSEMLYGTALVASTPGAKLAFTSSRCFDLKFLTHDWSGIAKVYRDGALVREVDLYTPVGNATHKEFFAQDAAEHAYTIEVSDKRNPASHANEVWVDAVLERTHCAATPNG